MTTNRPGGPTPPFQFTLRHLITAIAICSVLLALIVQLGGLGIWISLIAGSLFLIVIGARYENAGSLVPGVIGLVVSLWLGSILSHSLSHPIEGSRHASCVNNLHNIAVALQQYHHKQGCYPPPYIADADGKPMHSWRVLILPYLEQKALHSQYRFDEPWDGPNNRKLHSIALKIFACPSQDDKPPRCETNYVAVIGPRTVWPGGNASIRDADIIDGLSNTLLVVEVANSGIHWMEPRDLHVDQMPMAINAPRGQGISSHHPGGTNLAFADGGIRFFTNNTPPKTIREILTRNGKEPVGSLNP